MRFVSARYFSFLSLFLFFLFSGSTVLAAPKKVDLRGLRLSVLIKENLDFTRTETEYFVTRNGKQIKLRFSEGKAPKGLHSGMRVNVKGDQINAAAVKVGADSSSFQVVSGGAIAGATGVRQVLVLKIKSATAESSVTQTQIAGVFASVDTWYKESSYDLLSVKNDRNLDGLADFYTVSISAASAGVGESSAFTFCSSAKTAAKTQHGADPALWNHVVCILPPDMNYGWFGQAYINGSDIVINGNYAHGYPGGYTHELGHNLGMHHSNTPGVEYGETSCVMGGNAGTGRRDFNGPHKTQLNWLSAQSAGAGSYELNAVEAQPAQRTSGSTLLKIRDSVANEDLYISYRAPLGTFAPGLNLPNRTSVHSYNGGAIQTQLLASLADGETFSRNGIVISQVAHTLSTSSVVIGANCSAAAPQLTLSPASVLNSQANSAVFTVTLANKDLNCSGTVIFSLAINVPSGWTAALGSNTITAAPGQSASASFTVTPPAGLTSSSTIINVSATADAHPSATASATYVLDNNLPGAAGNLTATVTRQGKVTLSWLAASDIGSGIAGYDIYRNNIKIGSASGTSYSNSPGTGSFSYYLITRDQAGNLSAASNTVQITISKGGGKR